MVNSYWERENSVPGLGWNCLGNYVIGDSIFLEDATAKLSEPPALTEEFFERCSCKTHVDESIRSILYSNG